jgi:hypothetical protein
MPRVLGQEPLLLLTQRPTPCGTVLLFIALLASSRPCGHPVRGTCMFTTARMSLVQNFCNSGCCALQLQISTCPRGVSAQSVASSRPCGTPCTTHTSSVHHADDQRGVGHLLLPCLALPRVSMSSSHAPYVAESLWSSLYTNSPTSPSATVSPALQPAARMCSGVTQHTLVIW